jgi:hypothetical protein
VSQTSSESRSAAKDICCSRSGEVWRVTGNWEVVCGRAHLLGEGE